MPLYDTAMQKMRSLARAVLSCEDRVEEQIEFIQQSVTQLLKARHVLKCSYVYGYYLEQTGYKKPIFECMQVQISFLCFLYIIARDSIYAKRAYAIAVPSVCLSVSLSHGWISQKRLKLGSCNFHHTVAPSL